jgi:hypothetical protein
LGTGFSLWPGRTRHLLAPSEQGRGNDERHHDLLHFQIPQISLSEHGNYATASADQWPDHIRLSDLCLQQLFKYIAIFGVAPICVRLTEPSAGLGYWRSQI